MKYDLCHFSKILYIEALICGFYYMTDRKEKEKIITEAEDFRRMKTDILRADLNTIYC